ncbi:DUF1801 domain-containing protein [Haloferula sp. BvORR071]|uniref:iron chaperone n=1 Tax=Haloferula sp. BvORR071 TaxID=1396141 RepID=UPI00054EF694|nr:DUF1801 domain-containing protein [Haloferula sp. BvORR071]
MADTPPPATIDAYIADFPPEIRAMLERMRAIISKASPKASETIAWGMPTFKQDGNLVHFAAFKRHMSLFASTSTVTHFKGELADYVTHKATIQFPYGKPLPAALITKLVKHRIAENAEKLAAKRARGK